MNTVDIFNEFVYEHIVKNVSHYSLELGKSYTLDTKFPHRKIVINNTKGQNKKEILRIMVGNSGVICLNMLSPVTSKCYSDIISKDDFYEILILLEDLLNENISEMYADLL